MSDPTPATDPYGHPVTPLPPGIDTRHMHKRGRLLSTHWVNGRKVNTWTCEVEGCAVVLT